jgi:hypothetical protein
VAEQFSPLVTLELSPVFVTADLPGMVGGRAESPRLLLLAGGWTQSCQTRPPKFKFPYQQGKWRDFLVLGRLGGAWALRNRLFSLNDFGEFPGQYCREFFPHFFRPARDFKSPWREIIGPR